MHRRTRAKALALIAALTLGACGGGGDDSNDDAKNAQKSSSVGERTIHVGEATVRIQNFEFKPKAISVKPGTKVTWKNEDASIHDVKDTSPLATPISPEMGKGDTFSITYAQPGSYSYICGIHPYMVGSVEVVA
jgi:plastocyanin